MTQLVDDHDRVDLARVCRLHESGDVAVICRVRCGGLRWCCFLCTPWRLSDHLPDDHDLALGDLRDHQAYHHARQVDAIQWRYGKGWPR